MSVREDREEEQCPVCLCELSLKLQGEKPHVVPVCLHRLHHDCFEAVYGSVERARTKPPGSLGLCGICRKDMRVGECESPAGKKNKFATMAGLPQSDDRSSHKMHSTTRGTLRDDQEPDSHDPTRDDELFSGVLSPSSLHADVNSTSHPDTYSIGSTGRTISAARRGSLATSASSASSIKGVPSSGTGAFDIVRPILKVRSEHTYIERSSEPDKKQHMTCIVTVEMPSRWPTPMPLVEGVVADEIRLPSSPPAPQTPLQDATQSLSRLGLGSSNSATNLSEVERDAHAAVVDDLKSRMCDWKGHAPDEFGALRLHETLLVKKDNKVREFAVYLFEEAILCVTDDTRKGLAGKLAAGFSGHPDRLRLKGRVYIRHIRSIIDSSNGPDWSLTIMMSDDALDEFVMTFKDRTKLERWRDNIAHLIATHSAPGTPPQAAAARGIVASASYDSFPTSENSSVSHRTQLSAFSGFTRTTSSTAPPQPASTVYEVDETGDRSEAQRYACSSRYPASPYSAAYSPVSPPSFSSYPGTPMSPASAACGSRDWPSLDLMIIISVPPPDGPSTSLKLGIIKSSLAFLVAHVGPKTRISLVVYTAGESSRGGTLRKTPYIAIGSAHGRQRFDQAITELSRSSLGATNANDQGQVLLGHHEERVSVVTACNLALDIVLQRKSKATLNGIVLVNDGRGDANKQQMDLVLARAEAANTPVHTLGWGKAHDPSSLWLLSNHTGGSYTFVKDFYDLRDSLSGVVGGILSIAATDVRLHIAVLEQRSVRIRKVSGTPGAVLSKSGADVDIDLGELRFGDKRELLVEVEMSLSGKNRRDDDGGHGLGLGLKTGITGVGDASDISTATDEFFLSRVGFSPSDLEDGSCDLYDNEYASMPDEVPLFEVNAAYRDPAAGKTVSRLNHTPTLLTVTVLPPPKPSVYTQSPAGASVSTLQSSPLLAGSNIDITRRRVELLTSDMLSRALMLIARGNDQQAIRVLEETKRIIATLAQSSLGGSPSSSSIGGAGSFVRPSSHLHAAAQARRSLHACTESVQSVLEGCADRARFETQDRYAAAQNAVVLRDQRAFGARSSTERLFWNEDNSRWMVAKSHDWVDSR